MKKKTISLLLALILLLSSLLAGCGDGGGAADAGGDNTPSGADNKADAGGALPADLMAGIEPGEPEPAADLGADAAAITDFGVRLFQAAHAGGENTLISPLSVLAALGMAANGARGETLAQMEAVFGLDSETLNQWLYTCMSSLPQSEKSRLSLANSIWLRAGERLSVEPGFLQANADYYGASVRSEPFDESTVDAINGWVRENTDGMINDIISEISDFTVMYLINALAFDAEWEQVYSTYDVGDGVFTTEDGVGQEVELMYSEEGSFIETGSARGFVKYYAGGDYAFAALLPDEGVSVSELAASLSGAELHAVLSSPQSRSVRAALPKFELEYAVELKDILAGMGMPDAFDSALADLTALGSSTNGNLYISRVLHKTFISVDELGTKAGAVTAVEVNDCAEPMYPETVILDRPFVYMLIDCKTNTPFFIGALMSVE